MERRRNTPPNVTEQLLYQERQAPEETERRVTAIIETITDKQKGNGQKYKVVEFVNGEGEIQRLNVFEPHLIEGLEPGMAIELALKKSRSGWCNLDSVIRPDQPKDELDAFFDANPEPPT